MFKVFPAVDEFFIISLKMKFPEILIVSLITQKPIELQLV